MQSGGSVVSPFLQGCMHGPWSTHPAASVTAVGCTGLTNVTFHGTGFYPTTAQANMVNFEEVGVSANQEPLPTMECIASTATTLTCRLDVPFGVYSDHCPRGAPSSPVLPPLFLQTASAALTQSLHDTVFWLTGAGVHEKQGNPFQFMERCRASPTQTAEAVGPRTGNTIDTADEPNCATYSVGRASCSRGARKCPNIHKEVD